MVRLSLKELLDNWEEGVNIVDARDPMAFADGFLTGSFYSYPDRNFVSRVKSFLKPDEPLAIITDNAHCVQLEQILEKNGLRNLKGVCSFDGQNLTEAPGALDIVIAVSAEEFGMDLKYDEKLLAVDLRSDYKFQVEHVQGAMSLPLMELTDIVQVANLDDNRNIYFYAEGNEDAMTAASILKRHGLHQIRIVAGGWNEIRQDTQIRTDKVKASKN